jgi:acetyl-CoA carboxylase biotin carboxylase subunit
VLNLKQEDIKFNGHAIECRINAEDYLKDFQPSAGTIKVYHQPSGPGTRVDGCIYQGSKVQPYYDSLIVKLICYGEDRNTAINISKRALDEFVITGIETTIGLHKKILKHEDFINSRYDTNWLANSNILN